MLTQVLIKLGMALFSVLPIERILAVMLNKWINKIDPNNINKARKTAEHLAELSGLFNDILADESVTVEELTALKGKVIAARKELLEAWATGKIAKGLQNSLYLDAGNKVYAEPLLRVNGIGGRSTIAVRPPSGMFLVATATGIGLALLVAGCGTLTRCQSMRFENCTITVNEPSNLENPSYPRALQIGVQDQMIEGGADKIASGNDTKPTLTVPVGDSVLGAASDVVKALLPSKTNCIP